MTEWISVKDRLPEKNKKVLVYSEPEKGFENEILSSFGIHTAYIPTYGIYFTESLPNCGCTGISGEITHWMPLPEVPEKK